MRRLTMTSASVALLFGAAACTSTPEPEPVAPPPAPVVEEPEPEVVEVVEEIVEEPVGPLAGSIEDFQVNVGDRVYFDLDEYVLTQDARSVLRRQAAWLSAHDGVNIMVAGNCDERGTREYNLALGERRANAAKNYLVGLGVSPDRIRTVSYGKERPVALDSTPRAWAQNRRAASIIIN